MIALNWPEPARAEADISTQCGFGVVGVEGYSIKALSYNNFMMMPTATKNHFIDFWLSGFLTGLSLKSEICSTRISACIDSTTRPQRLTMLDKEASDSPEKWNVDHYIAWYMLSSFVIPCLKGEIPLKKKK